MWRKRFFIALSLYPISFFANTPFNKKKFPRFRSRFRSNPLFYFSCNFPVFFVIVYLTIKSPPSLFPSKGKLFMKRKNPKNKIFC